MVRFAEQSADRTGAYRYCHSDTGEEDSDCRTRFRTVFTELDWNRIYILQVKMDPNPDRSLKIPIYCTYIIVWRHRNGIFSGWGGVITDFRHYPYRIRIPSKFYYIWIFYYHRRIMDDSQGFSLFSQDFSNLKSESDIFCLAHSFLCLTRFRTSSLVGLQLFAMRQDFYRYQFFIGVRQNVD